MLAVALPRLPDLPLPRRSGRADAERAGDARRSATNCATRLGLDRGFVMQFATFVGNAVRGDFGISYRNQQDVFTLIAERFPATLRAGVRRDLPVAAHRHSARRLHRDPPQHACRAGCCSSSRCSACRCRASRVGILLILVFSVTLGWLPAFGRGEVVQLGWWIDRLSDAIGPRRAHPARRSRCRCSRSPS